MPWRVDHDGTTEVVTSVYTGILTEPELMASEAATTQVALSKRSQRFLADCSALTGGHSIFDLYEVLQTLGPDSPFAGAREAVLLAEHPGDEMVRNMEFWKTACQNRGIDVRVFHDRAAALAWLGTR